jgi:hypothetical protein
MCEMRVARKGLSTRNIVLHMVAGAGVSGTGGDACLTSYSKRWYWQLSVPYMIARYPRLGSVHHGQKDVM